MLLTGRSDACFLIIIAPSWGSTSCMCMCTSTCYTCTCPCECPLSIVHVHVHVRGRLLYVVHTAVGVMRCRVTVRTSHQGVWFQLQVEVQLFKRSCVPSTYWRHWRLNNLSAVDEREVRCMHNTCQGRRPPNAKQSLQKKPKVLSFARGGACRLHTCRQEAALSALQARV